MHHSHFKDNPAGERKEWILVGQASSLSAFDFRQPLHFHRTAKIQTPTGWKPVLQKGPEGWTRG
jgi:hypothetical protein